MWQVQNSNIVLKTMCIIKYFKILKKGDPLFQSLLFRELCQWQQSLHWRKQTWDIVHQKYLEVGIKLIIPLNIHTNTSGYTAVPSNQNVFSIIACPLLDNPICTAAYKPMIFTILANSNNEFQLSILKALLITRHKPELHFQKQFYTPFIFNNPIGPREENIITHANSSDLW